MCSPQIAGAPVRIGTPFWQHHGNKIGVIQCCQTQRQDTLGKLECKGICAKYAMSRTGMLNNEIESAPARCR
jgi:hypothetical protein